MSRMKMMLTIAGVGLVIASGGLAYGIFAVGVPYQDPTAAQAAAERANAAISGWTMGGGVLILLAGVGGSVILGLRRVVWPRS